MDPDKDPAPDTVVLKLESTQYSDNLAGELAHPSQESRHPIATHKKPRANMACCVGFPLAQAALDPSPHDKEFAFSSK